MQAVLKNTKDEFYNSKMEELYASRYMNVIYDDLIGEVVLRLGLY